MKAQNRIKRGADYRRIVKLGQRYGGKYFLIYVIDKSTALDNIQSGDFCQRPHESAKFGFIITRAVGNAVTRNLVRRRMKHITALIIENGFSEKDIVIRVFPSAVKLEYSALKDALEKQLNRISGC